MDNKEYSEHDIIDKDLYEELDDEELYELLKKGREEVLEKERLKKANHQPKRPFPKWIFWLIAFAMVFNVLALLPQTFSIPAIDFLKTSARLSIDEQIKEYKKSVVVIETENSRGTGFSINNEGVILTNHHVVEGEETVTVVFPDDGFFIGHVVESYPEIDLAVLETKGDNLPHLNLAEKTIFEENESVNFIGNPLRFQGIANEGEILEYIRLNNWDEDVVMIKAPIYRGNSGSPIINKQGKVIGVVFATLNHSEHGRVGLFVPIDYYYEHVLDD